MDVLAKILCVDSSSRTAKIAEWQVDEDAAYLEFLIEKRELEKPDAAGFAKSIGVSVDELLSFESDPINFDLGFIRRYSIALGRMVEHRVYDAEFYGSRKVESERQAQQSGRLDYRVFSESQVGVDWQREEFSTKSSLAVGALRDLLRGSL